MAAREVSRDLRGSAAQAVYNNTLQATIGQDEACNSCDDRQKRAKSIVRAFAKSIGRAFAKKFQFIRSAKRSQPEDAKRKKKRLRKPRNL